MGVDVVVGVKMCRRAAHELLEAPDLRLQAGEDGLEAIEPGLDLRQLLEPPAVPPRGSQRGLREAACVPGGFRGLEEQVQISIGRKPVTPTGGRLTVLREDRMPVLRWEAVKKG